MQRPQRLGHGPHARQPLQRHRRVVEARVGGVAEHGDPREGDHHRQQDAKPDGAGNELQQADERHLVPNRERVRRHQRDNREGGSRGDEQAEDGGEPGRPHEAGQSRLRELRGAPGDAVAAGHGRQRERKPDDGRKAHRHRLRQRGQAERQGPVPRRGRRQAVSRRHGGDETPDRGDDERGQRNPDPPLEHAGADALAQPRAKPEDADEADGCRGGEVAGRDVLGEPRQPENRHEQGHDIVARDAGHQRREEQALDQDGRGRRRGLAAAECLVDAARQAAGHEQRPALEIGRAQDDSRADGDEDEPGPGRADRGDDDARDEERGDPQLREGERDRAPRGDELAQRRRRKDDRDSAYRPRLVFAGWPSTRDSAADCR